MLTSALRPSLLRHASVHPSAWRSVPCRLFSTVSQFATVDPVSLSASEVHHIENLVEGEWRKSKETYSVVDPLNGEPFIKAPKTTSDELGPFVSSLKKVPKSGRHNPLKSPERYLMYGRVFQKAAEHLHDPEVLDFFVKCIQRVMPKSYAQCKGEMTIIRTFLENFSGDSVRFLCRGFTVAGDHLGQQSQGYRWPYGPVAVISPFNFPLEICGMQMLGAAMVGNKPVVKTESTMGMPVEQFIRFMHFCGLPKDEIDFISCRGPVMSDLVSRAAVRMVQFTGSSETSEKLSKLTKGRMKTEDSGFDWKILGPDVSDPEYVAWQCDQDAYAMSGQKCSAQSLVAAHKNWVSAGLYDKVAALAKRRSLAELTLSPVLSHTTKDIMDHIEALSSLPGARLLFGGRPLEDHKIPEQYGAVEPSAVLVPLDTLLQPNFFPTCTRELFGPVQVVTEWQDGEEGKLIEMCEWMSHHLTAAVVSSDMLFLQKILGSTVNGTTYAGLRARTTGAPQNHWFGPAGDPMAAGIGTPEAILQTWTCHREVVFDHGPIPEGWTTPPPT
ncbi:unnamed protein product [Vitrella brassicaformis CCMP3155]|uniref:Aldehyde dehydrogenase domain-containing protein n=2 Tax=Vitrella brassicaformis TaxID=1169539 RepID=A0A0G4F3J9_VITBC|nr:unnamed protein product [Vitrella brassicaformis CCMP3155]|eukprot:CEM06404.1 unnamed protein product [Vitrella brassicaformis CCMP3155]